MRLTILGCYSATPRVITNPTSQVLELNGHTFLIDCGEGTQVELRRHKIKFNSISHVFISHLHGDHFFGLMGVITTFSLLNREKPLHIHGPKGIKEICLLQLKLSKGYTNYPLYFHELTASTPEVLLEDDKIMVSTLPLQHRIYANGFLFQAQPNDRKLDVVKAEKAGVDVAYFRKAKQGLDVPNKEGKLIASEEITSPPAPPQSYAFCSDTAYHPPLAELIQGTTVLYHESTFQEEHAELAAPTGHSTAKQAAQIAKAAGVDQLILGHYSTRYTSLKGFKEEAATIFPCVHLAEDGKVFQF
ncbi:ribonuclease Z [Croceiramulus getboli]|nr:ribonuclease Z [Flavobacteriaceae bacterium YJPT1-3]